MTNKKDFIDSRISKFPFSTHDLYKFIALFLMFIDHLGYYILLDTNLWLRCIGRLSFPIFAYLYGKNFKKNNYNLLGNGAVLFILSLIDNQIWFNTLISFFIGGICLKFFNKINDNLKFVFIEILIVIHFFISKYLDYGIFAFLFMLVAQNINKKEKNSVFYFLSVFIFYFIDTIRNFGFDKYQSVFLGLTMLIECYYLYHYDNKILKENVFIKYVARYSMEIYFLQQVIFTLISLKIS